MTFEDRVRALMPLGLTPRQTRFLALVALHGGFCLRRQYAAFARIGYGRHVREFLDELVARDLSRRISYKRNRGFVYHLHAKSVYRAIEQEDNRNRRVASPALVARKLMMLDVVIDTPGVEWFATEDDKVRLFTDRFGVSPADLPVRVYEAREPDEASTARAFVHKLPIYLQGDPARTHFVCLANGAGDRGTDAFLRDHARLLTKLTAWTVVITGPRHTSDFRSSQRAFDRFCGERSSTVPGLTPTGLRWFCQTRQIVEAEQLERLSLADITRFRDTRRRLSPEAIDPLYEQWLTSGDAAIERYARGTSARRFLDACLEIRLLPFRYDQFGDLPGVC
jgi:hypothetical protein